MPVIPNIFAFPSPVLAFADAAPGAPVLAIDSGGNLTWTWTGTDPVFWAVENSPDGITFTNFGAKNGTDRDFGSTVNPAEFWRIIGSTDSGGTLPVTAYSNTVTFAGLVGMTAVTLTGATQRNDANVALGFQFVAQVGMTITKVGRWCLPGNNQTHTVSIYIGALPAPTLAASVDIDASLGTPNSFQYVELSSPLTINGDDMVTIVSAEPGGTELWYGNEGAYTFSASLGSVFAIYQSSGIGADFTATTPDTSYVPLNFLYTIP